MLTSASGRASVVEQVVRCSEIRPRCLSRSARSYPNTNPNPDPNPDPNPNPNPTPNQVPLEKREVFRLRCGSLEFKCWASSEEAMTELVGR